MHPVVVFGVVGILVVLGLTLVNVFQPGAGVQVVADVAQPAVVNVLAWRATNPNELPPVEQAIGPRNEYWMQDAMGYADLVVPAWGVARKGYEAAYEAARQAIMDFAASWSTPVEALGYTKHKHPWHPLYVPYETERQPWPVEA